LVRLGNSSRKTREELQAANDRSAAEAALAANYQQKLRALSESSGAGIVMLDAQGRVVHTNATAERILGVDPGAVVGHALLQATLSRELQDFALQAIRDSRSDSQDFNFGADSRIFRASIYPFQTGLSGSAETMLVLVDVTELRRLETVRRDFVANVSHELRTPLASIRAMAETLEDGALHDEEVATRFLETIIREADRLTRIADDLLVLADAESKPPTKERFDLHPLLLDLTHRFEPQAQERAITLSLSSEPGLFVLGTRDQLEQVFVNLLDNAIKYSLDKGVVEVSARRTPGSVCVDVKDSGIGIMQEHLSRIFERFYRVDKARSRESGGTGLGLAIAKNIVEAHGGQVAVSSEFNHGSTFAVTLPSPEEPQ
jgi:two-component system phosphate regulon sensor histidine kinase PhoR